MDARQRLLDALAEVERLAARTTKGSWVPHKVDGHVISTSSGYTPQRLVATCMGFSSSGSLSNLVTDENSANASMIVALHALLPTLSALREVVEIHELGTGGLCRACSYIDDEDCVEGEEYPCSTLRTLTRQFEEE